MRSTLIETSHAALKLPLINNLWASWLWIKTKKQQRASVRIPANGLQGLTLHFDPVHLGRRWKRFLMNQAFGWRVCAPLAPSRRAFLECVCFWGLCVGGLLVFRVSSEVQSKLRSFSGGGKSSFHLPDWTHDEFVSAHKKRTSRRRRPINQRSQHKVTT